MNSHIPIVPFDSLGDMRKSPILDALFPAVRTKILAATVPREDKEWYLTELASFLHTSPSSLPLARRGFWNSAAMGAACISS
jgi:hypothetical protein